MFIDSLRLQLPPATNGHNDHEGAEEPDGEDDGHGLMEWHAIAATTRHPTAAKCIHQLTGVEMAAMFVQMTASAQKMSVMASFMGLAIPWLGLAVSRGGGTFPQIHGKAACRWMTRLASMCRRP